MTDGIATGFQGIQQQDRGGDTRAFETAAKNAGGKQAPIFERFPDKGIIKVHEGQRFAYDFKASDPDGGRQTYELTDKADGKLFEITKYSGILTFKHAPDFEKPADGNKDNVYDVQIKLVDDEGQTTTRTVWVKVQDKAEVNHAPHFTRFPENGMIHVKEGVEGEIYNFNSSDKDGDHVTYSLGGVDGDQFQITEDRGRLSFKTAPDFEAPADRNGDNTYDVDIILTDEHGATTKKTVWVKVGDVDEKPVDEKPVFENLPKDGKITIDEGEVHVVDVDGNDPDGGEVTFSLKDKADSDKFTIDARTGKLAFKEAPDFEHPTDGNKNNIYDVHVRITDNEGNTCDKTLWVMVRDVDENKLPTAGDDGFEGEFGAVITGDVKGNDTPGDAPATYEATSQPDGGTLEFRGDGTFTFTPDEGFSGTTSFIYQVKDVDGDTAEATVTLKVGEKPNQVPTAGDDGFTGEFGETFTGDLTKNDTPGDGASVYALDEQSANGTATVNEDGTFSFVPDYGFSGETTFTYTLTDEDGDTATAAVTITIDERPDEKPVFENLPKDGKIHVNEGEVAVVDVDGNDPDGGDVTYSIVGGRDADFFTIDRHTGELTFKEARDFEKPESGGGNNTYDVKVRITDDEGTTCDKALWVMIKDVDENAAPVAADDSYTATAPADGERPVARLDLADGLLTNDSDPDGDSIAVLSVNGVSLADAETIRTSAFEQVTAIEVDGGRVEFSYDDAIEVDPDFEPAFRPDTITFVPNDGFEGDVEFPYTISDPSGLTSTATVRVHVPDAFTPPVNNPPVAVDDSAETEQGQPVQIEITANDSDTDAQGDPSDFIVQEINGQAVTQGEATYDTPNGTLRYFGNDFPEPGVGQVATETVFTPNPDFTGTETFTYTIVDSEGETSTATVSIEVKAPVDEKPIDPVDPNKVMVDFEGFAAGDMPTDFDGLFIEGFRPGSDTNAAMVFDTRNPTGGDDDLAVDGQGNVLIISEDDDATDPDDNAGGGQFVLSFDTPSTLESIALLDIEGQGGTIELFGEDGFIRSVDIPAAGDGSVQTVQIDEPGVTGATVNLVGSGAIDDVCFVKGEAAPPKPEDKLPTAGDDMFTTDENTTVTGDVTLDDTPGDGPATYEATSEPANGTLEFRPDGTFTYTPADGFDGVDSFTYQVTDADDDVAEATVVVVVKDTIADNTAPDADSDFADTDENTAVTIDVLGNDTDADGDTLTIDSVTDAANGTVEIVDGQIVYTPNDGFDGTDTFTYTVSDGQGGTDTATVKVCVKDTVPDNVAPVARDDSATTGFGEAVTIDAYSNDFDPDGAGNAVFPGQIVDGPINGTVELVDGQFVYTPNDGFSGDDAFTYTVVDDQGLESAPATVSIHVGAEDLQPVAVDDSEGVESGQILTETVAGNDTLGDGDNTFILAMEAMNGTVTLAEDGSYTYEANDGFVGNDVFRYTITDGDGDTSSATVRIHVSAADKAPVAVDDANTVEIGGTATGDVGANDVAGDGDSRFELIDEPVNGTVEFNADGTYTYTPGDVVGNDTFTYKIIDADGDESEGRVTIEVSEKDIRPDAMDDTGHVERGKTLHGNVGGNDVRGNGDNVFELAHEPVNGTLTFNADGSYDYVPDDGFVGRDVFSYKLTDEDGDQDRAKVIITTKAAPDTNTAVDAIDDTAETVEGTPVSGNVLTNDVDEDGDDLIAFLSEAPQNGTVTIARDGSYTYTPADGFTGTDTFNYVAIDEDGNRDEATVTVTVTDDGKEPPVAKRDSASTEPGQAVIVDVTANDNDPNGENDALEVVEINGRPISSDETGIVGNTVLVTNGAVTLLPDGTLSVEPNPGFEGGDIQFNYTVRDEEGLTDRANVTVHVGQGNTPPDAIDDGVDTEAGEPITIEVLANDTDADDDTLTITDVGTPANGTATLNADGSVTYTPDDGFSGDDTFTYTIDDGNGGADTATVTVHVKKDNTPPPVEDKLPDARFDRNSTEFETPVSGTVATNDFEGDGPATFSLFREPANGTVVVNADGSYTYTPDAGFSGTDTFRYEITDVDGDTDRANVRIMVGEDKTPPPPPVEDKLPDAVDDGFDGEFGQPIAGSVGGNDDPGDAPATFEQASQPTNGTVVFNEDGTFVYTPNAGFSGDDSFTYTIRDADGDVDTATVSLHVGEDQTPPPVDLRPDAVNDAFDGVGGQPIAGNVATNDDLGDTPSTFATLTQPQNGTLTFNDDGTFVYTPNFGFTGTDSFVYTVTDEDGDVDAAVVKLNIAKDEADIEPVARNDEFTLAPGTTVTDTVAGNDDLGNTPSVFMQISDPANGTVAFNGDGTFSYVPNAGFTGTDAFAYKVTDADGDVSTAIVCLKVEDNTPPPPANKRPDAVDDSAVTEFDTPVSGSVADNDVNGDGASTFALVRGASNGTAVVNPDGSYTYTPNAGFVGFDTFTYSITDADGDVDTATVTVEVKKDQTPPPPPPVDLQPDAVDDAFNVPFGQTVTGTLADNDFAGDDPARFSLVTGSPDGTVTVNPDGSFSFVPNPGFSGDTQFVYRITDADGDTDTAVVRLHVAPNPNPQLPPVANDDGATTEQGDTVTINVLGNDTEPEGEVIRVTGIVRAPANGVATVNADGTIDYTPNADFFGTDTFVYSIVDEDGLTDTATVTVTVDRDVPPPPPPPVNKPPHVVDDMAMGPTDQPLTVNLLGNDKDPDGDALLLTSFDGRPVKPGDVVYLPNATVSINSDGTVTYRTRDGFVGTLTNTYHVSDGRGGTDSGQVVVQFKDVTPPPPPPPVNQPPHAVKDGYYLRPGLHYILPVLHNDKDPDGDPIHIVQINGHDLKPCESIRVEGGIVTLRKDGQLVFKGNRGTYGDFRFDYTITDGKGGFDTAPVYVCLTNGGRRH